MTKPDIKSAMEEDSREITRILHGVHSADSGSTDELIAVLYDELRRLATFRLARESPGQTLQPTALVHEAYLRLSKPDGKTWANRREFFGAAAEIMRRILIDNARRKMAVRRGGKQRRSNLDPEKLTVDPQPAYLIDLDAALEEFSTVDPESAELVRLRYFGGLSVGQTAAILEISPRTATNRWTYAKTWLRRRLAEAN